MLLGEYDFGDTYSGSTWPAKLLFVVFVIFMSVVLMNLVIGLAVNDVDTIQRQSRMMRMLSESNIVAFLEEVCEKIESKVKSTFLLLVTLALQIEINYYVLPHHANQNSAPAKKRMDFQFPFQSIGIRHLKRKSKNVAAYMYVILIASLPVILR